MQSKYSIFSRLLPIAISCVWLSGCAATKVASTTKEVQSANEQLTIATWNVEHLAYPVDTGCNPRTQQELAALLAYSEKVDADVYALQEVASAEAVRQLFPVSDWQVVMSSRPDSEPYTCRGTGFTSTQQKVAFAVRNGIDILSTENIGEIGLSNPGLRYGLAITINSESGPIDILNLHLKSGCFVDDFNRSDDDDCPVIAKQAPIVKDWIMAREKIGRSYIVTGDFNHRLSAPYNRFTRLLNDPGTLPELSLHNATGHVISCHPRYPAPIDHIFIGNLDKASATATAQMHYFEDMDNMLSDHCALSADIINADQPLTNAVKWQTTSAEYKVITQAIYRQASDTLKSMSLPSESWVVVMDVDETILDNSPYQVERNRLGLTFTLPSWNYWVKQEKAQLVPGVKDFINTVNELGGKLAFVTNRDRALDEYTWSNLLKTDLPVTADNTCLIGRAAVDKDSSGNNGIINDKDLRRQQISNGEPPCYQPEDQQSSNWQQAHQIIMQVGDNIEDIAQVLQHEADIEALLKRQTYDIVVLPNPMYGSW